jgi:septum formation inhibitor MinC
VLVCVQEGDREGWLQQGYDKEEKSTREEEEHEKEESAQAEPAREEPAQEEEPAQDADYEPEAVEASGGSTRQTTLVVTLLVSSTSEVARDSRRGRYRLLNGR